MDEFEKALEENGPRFNFESTPTNPSKRIDPGFAAGARWAREWCENNTTIELLLKDVDAVRELNDKLLIKNQRLREALELADTQFEGLRLGFEKHGTNINIAFHIDYCLENREWIKQALAETER